MLHLHQPESLLGEKPRSSDPGSPGYTACLPPVKSGDVTCVASSSSLLFSYLALGWFTFKSKWEAGATAQHPHSNRQQQHNSLRQVAARCRSSHRHHLPNPNSPRYLILILHPRQPPVATKKSPLSLPPSLSSHGFRQTIGRYLRASSSRCSHTKGSEHPTPLSPRGLRTEVHES